VLLEPVMALEVVTPEARLGDVIGDLNSRRARITGMEASPGGTQTIRTNAPLAEMFGYSTVLRSLTQGRATYTMEPSHYAAVPEPVSQHLVARAGGVG
jgi:elongation factor G